MKKICVIDIGGTNIRGSVYSVEGLNKRVIYYKTPNYFYLTSHNKIINQIVSIVKEIYNKFNYENDYYLDGLAMCFPGPVSYEGNILGSSVIFGSGINKPINLKRIISEELNTEKIILINDITAASFRYNKDIDRFCIITVSSGIGSKIFIDNKVIIDKLGRSGEIGHVTTNFCPELYVECPCGNGINHIGSISSGRGIEYTFNELKSNKNFSELYKKSSPYSQYRDGFVKAKEIAGFVDAGDEYSEKIIDYCTKPLAYEICILLTALHLERIIIIGGFALNCEYFIKSLKKNVKDFGIYNYTDDEIEEIISLGVNDDYHSLIGLGEIGLTNFN